MALRSELSVGPVSSLHGPGGSRSQFHTKNALSPVANWAAILADMITARCCKLAHPL